MRKQDRNPLFPPWNQSLTVDCISFAARCQTFFWAVWYCCMNHLLPPHFFTRVDSKPTHTHSVHVCIPYHDTQAGCRARSRCSCKFFPVNPSACSRVRSWSGQHCLLKTLLPDGYHAREHLDLHRARQNHLENFKNIFHNDSIAHVENIRGMFSYQNNKKWFFRITTETQSPSSTWLPSNRKNNILPQEWLASQIHFHHISMFNRQKMCNIISIVIYLFYPDIYFAPCFRLHTPCFIHVLYLKQPKTV